MLGSREIIPQGFIVQAAPSDPDLLLIFDRKWFPWSSAKEEGKGFFLYPAVGLPEQPVGWEAALSAVVRLCTSKIAQALSSCASKLIK